MRENTPTIFVVSDFLQQNSPLMNVVESMNLPYQTFDSPQSFLDFNRERRPGCLVLEILRSRSNQLELLEKLSELRRELPAIVVTSHGTPAMVVRAFQLGAIDFMEYLIDPGKLSNSIQDAISVEAKARKRLTLQLELEAKLATLSKQEAEVLELITAGFSGKKIAALLDVSLRTIGFRRSSIQKKTNTSSLSELMNLIVTIETLKRQNILPHRYLCPHRNNAKASPEAALQEGSLAPAVFSDFPALPAGLPLER